MLLDQPQVKKNRLTVSGNNQLLKGAIFALITLVWFSFLFAFIDMNWDNFTPAAPFIHTKDKHKFIFYFICFSFFISSLVFSLIFYKKNLQPTDILMRFAMILIFLTVVFFCCRFFSNLVTGHAAMGEGGIPFIRNTDLFFKIMNVVLTFLVLYLAFYAIILFFSNVFFNGFFGLGGYVLCFFIAATFHVSVYLLQDIDAKMAKTGFPIDDITVLLFFTLASFGIGVVSGDEVKPQKKSRRVTVSRDLHN